jgi:hypothetical protein
VANDAVRVLIRQPVLGMTAEERDALMELIKGWASQGKVIVLGDKRCFFCGVELGERIQGDIRRMGEPTTRPVFVKLCDSCFKLVSA